MQPLKAVLELFSKRDTLRVPSNHLKAALGATPTYTGVSITTETAMRMTAVYACIRVLAESIASLPLFVYRRRSDGGKDLVTDHPLYRLLHLAPNPEQTSFNWREMTVGHLNTRGNAYSEIVRDQRGNVVELWPLNPAKVTPERAANGEIRFKYQNEKDRYTYFPYSQVLHIPGLQMSGLEGLSPIAQAREAIGLGLATEEYGARFFGNNSSPGGVLQVPIENKLKDQARENLKKSWEDAHKGLSTAHKVAVLEGGIEWKQIGITGRDAQFLETRKYQTNEICRIFRVPPHMIGDLERATFSNVEQQSIDFVVHTIRPWLVRIEQCFNTRLLRENEADLFAEFKVDGLLRGDIKSRYDAYATAIQNKIMSPNEVRALENLNPYEGGDVYENPSITVNSEGDPEPEEGPAGEENSERSALLPIIVDTQLRNLRRERTDVMRLADRFLSRGDVEGFKDNVRGLYTDHVHFCLRNLKPLSKTMKSTDLLQEIEAETLMNVKECERLVDESEIPSDALFAWFHERESQIRGIDPDDQTD